ncbi:hypothetical protein M3Y94_00003700 [Aphelenchoides besseyi]|nr:hypothetical protein M3Y94_00003700 [Aphelenchoides besseyi]
MEFEGKKGDGEYAKWTNENGKVASCASADNCDLKINKNGKLLTYTDDVDVGCNDVHKKIDETWVWSKFRVENLPVEYKFMITLRGTKEGTEYTPSPISTKKPTTNEPTIEESFTEEPTTEEPTTLANSETANSTTSHNSALSTRLGSSIFVLVSLFFVVL